MNVHPAAAIWPMLDDQALRQLAEDIGRRGLRHPIVVCDGMVLDGRNRLRACGLAEVEPRYTEFRGESPVAYVWSANFARRHLTTGQRAMFAADMLPALEAEAAARQGATRAKPGQRVGHVRAGLPAPTDHGRARDKAAEIAGVSARSVESAGTVLESGTPELVQAVRTSAVAVSTAAEIATLPAAEQVVVVAMDDDAIVRRAREIRTARADARRRARDEAAIGAAERAVAAAPTITGVDLRLADVADVVRDVRGAALVHADPNWQYDNQRLNGTAEKHYAVDAMAGIVAVVDASYDAALDDAYLVLWCTFPMLADWMAASAEMRWEYVSGGAWAKTGSMGIGFHWRGDAEIALLYRKGSPKPIATVSNAHVGPRSEHSEKPEAWLVELVGAFCPVGGLVLDLYAGLAPLARACALRGRRYVGAEIDEARRAEALLLLTGRAA